jgi:hypothetical protein
LLNEIFIRKQLDIKAEPSQNQIPAYFLGATMPELEDKPTTIIPDFYYDLIGRIAPGFVVVAVFLYWSGSNFEVVFSTIGQSVFALTVAWIIGTTLDAGVYYVGITFHADT